MVGGSSEVVSVGTMPYDVTRARAVHDTLISPIGNRGAVTAPERRAEEVVGGARDAMADLLGADPRGVVFGRSMTQLTFDMARTLARTWAPGDEVVVSRLDHDANVRPWVQAAGAAGTTVRWAGVDPATGELPVDQYADLVGPRTKVVAVTAASNAIGTVPRVREIAEVAHAVGALTYVDGVHATAHMPTDVAALGADFYVTSAYKWSGPHQAAVVAGPETWEGLSPEKLKPSPDTVPERFEFGTLSFEMLAAVTAAVDHLATLSPETTGSRRDRLGAGLTAAAAYENGLLDRLLKGLAAIPSVTVCPAPEHRCPTVSFRVDGQSPADTARLLGDQ